jgi:hypothetical protein
MIVGPSRSFQHLGGCKFEVWMKPLVARTPEARTGLSCVKVRSRFFGNLEFQSSAVSEVLMTSGRGYNGVKKLEVASCDRIFVWISGFRTLGVGNLRRQCSGIESLGLPVPESPKSRGSSDQEGDCRPLILYSHYFRV